MFVQDSSLPTHLWVAAHVRKCDALGMAVYIAHRGAADRGGIVLKLVLRNRQCHVFSQARDLDGELGWLKYADGAAIDEYEADQYIKRALERDKDLWVIEVETPEGQNPFEGKVL